MSTPIDQGDRPREPRQRQLVGWLWHTAAAAAAAGLLWQLEQWRSQSGWADTPVPLLGPGGLLLFALPMYLYARGQRHFAARAETVIAADRRPPVVYLRSFAGETAVNDAERGLANVVGALGPFIAIGMPGEPLPPLGASRAYDPKPDWQSFVTEAVGRARVVLMLAGSTPGLDWEIGLVRRTLDPRKLIVLVPKDLRAYAAFRMTAAQHGWELPDPPAGQSELLRHKSVAALISFDEAWTATYVWRHYGMLDALSAIDEEARTLRLELNDALRPAGIALPEPGERFATHWRLGVVAAAALLMAKAASWLWP